MLFAEKNPATAHNSDSDVSDSLKQFTEVYDIVRLSLTSESLLCAVAGFFSAKSIPRNPQLPGTRRSGIALR